MTHSSSAQARAELHARLQGRREEIEEAVIARVFALTGSAGQIDAEYAEGLRTAISAAIDHGLAAVKLGEEQTPPPPPALLEQARRAARSGVSLDAVLRRFFAGHALISDFLIAEAERHGKLSGARLQRLLRAQATVLDRVSAAVSEEHARERESHLRSAEQREVERIERLLAGELPETSQVAYDFEGHHLAAIAKGPGAPRAVREMTKDVGRRLLAVRREEDAAWVWLGSREPLDPLQLGRRAATLPTRVFLAIGEPAEGLAGWRLSHRQARAALPIALRGDRSFVRYADVALLASTLRDKLLCASLRELYLEPLEAERDGGEALRETLRAYLTAERNVSSTAAALGVKRHTVTKRLRAIEKRLGRPLSACGVEVEIALGLEELDEPILPRAALSRA
jgi:hypothetical protein